MIKITEKAAEKVREIAEAESLLGGALTEDDRRVRLTEHACGGAYVQNVKGGVNVVETIEVGAGWIECEVARRRSRARQGKVLYLSEIGAVKG